MWIQCLAECKCFKKCCFRRVTSQQVCKNSNWIAKCASNHAGAYAAVVFAICLGLLECATPLHDGHSVGLILYAAAKSLRHVMRLRNSPVAGHHAPYKQNIKQNASFVYAILQLFAHTRQKIYATDKNMQLKIVMVSGNHDMVHFCCISLLFWFTIPKNSVSSNKMVGFCGKLEYWFFTASFLHNRIVQHFAHGCTMYVR